MSLPLIAMISIVIGPGITIRLFGTYENPTVILGPLLGMLLLLAYDIWMLGRGIVVPIAATTLFIVTYVGGFTRMGELPVFPALYLLSLILQLAHALWMFFRWLWLRRTSARSALPAALDK